MRRRCGRSQPAALASLLVVATALASAGEIAAGASDPGGVPAREQVFTGACDASAAVPLTRRLFAVADDEDSVLRVYDADRGGEPLREVDLSAALFPPRDRAPGEPSKGKKKQKKRKRKGEKEKAPAADGGQDAEEGGNARRAPESDIEAAVRLGDVAYWMTSHGRNRSGKRKDARMLFFATHAGDGSDDLQLVGRAYEHLLDDLLADARYAPFGLAEASGRAPKAPDGLNLEGLGRRPEGGLWIGFRNPIPGGRALVAPLLNPEGLIQGERARLGEPILLDLGGLGIRSLTSWRGRTLIVAGDYAGGEGSQLFTWDGLADPVAAPGLDLGDFNPEGFFAMEERDEVLLLSDDGALEIDGVPCKRLDDSARKRFRGRWIAPPPPAR